MKLSMFSVVHERGDTAPLLDDPLIHCQATRQLVLAYVSRTALMDYFRIPGDKRITLQQWNLVVDRNLEAFKRIIEGKFERDEWEMEERLGQSYPPHAYHVGGHATQRRTVQGRRERLSLTRPSLLHISAETCLGAGAPLPAH